jgi:hypothetical protein
MEARECSSGRPENRRHFIDHLIGGRKQRRQNFDAKPLRSLEIDEQIEFGRLLA